MKIERDLAALAPVPNLLSEKPGSVLPSYRWLLVRAALFWMYPWQSRRQGQMYAALVPGMHPMRDLTRPSWAGAIEGWMPRLLRRARWACVGVVVLVPVAVAFFPMAGLGALPLLFYVTLAPFLVWQQLLDVFAGRGVLAELPSTSLSDSPGWHAKFPVYAVLASNGLLVLALFAARYFPALARPQQQFFVSGFSTAAPMLQQPFVLYSSTFLCMHMIAQATYVKLYYASPIFRRNLIGAGLAFALNVVLWLVAGSTLMIYGSSNAGIGLGGVGEVLYGMIWQHPWWIFVLLGSAAAHAVYTLLRSPRRSGGGAEVDEAYTLDRAVWWWLYTALIIYTVATHNASAAWGRFYGAGYNTPSYHNMPSGALLSQQMALGLLLWAMLGLCLYLVWRTAIDAATDWARNDMR